MARSSKIGMGRGGDVPLVSPVAGDVEMGGVVTRGALLTPQEGSLAEARVDDPSFMQKAALSLSYWLATRLPEGKQEWRYMDTILECVDAGNKQLGRLILGAIPVEFSGCTSRHSATHCPQLGPGDLVVNMTNPFETDGRGFWGVTPRSVRRWLDMGVDVIHCPMVDFSSQRERVATIARNSQLLNKMAETLRSGHQVYIHCKAGRSRSLLMLACFLGRYTKMSAAQILTLVKAQRPQVDEKGLEPVLRGFIATPANHVTEDRKFEVPRITYKKEVSYYRMLLNGLFIFGSAALIYARLSQSHDVLRLPDMGANNNWLSLAAGGVSMATYAGATFLPKVPLRAGSLLLAVAACCTVVAAQQLTIGADDEKGWHAALHTAYVVVATAAFGLASMLHVSRDAAKPRPVGGTPKMRIPTAGYAPPAQPEDACHGVTLPLAESTTRR